MKKLLAALLVLLPAAGWAQGIMVRPGFSSGGTVFNPILLPDGSAAAPSLGYASNPDVGFYKTGNTVAFSQDGNVFNVFGFTINGMQVGSASGYTWSSNSSALAAADLFLLRDAANILALRNTTNVQAQRWYGTYTDGSNYAYIGMTGSATGFDLATAALGTGVTDAKGGFKSIQGFKQKTITDAGATAFVRIDLPQTLGSNSTQGVLSYHVHCDNGTVGTYADRSGEVAFSCNNISGTEACVFDTTTAQTVTQAATYALAVPTWGATGGTDTIDLTANVDCTGVVGPTNMYIRYRLNLLTPQTVTPQ